MAGGFSISQGDFPPLPTSSQPKSQPSTKSVLVKFGTRPTTSYSPQPKNNIPDADLSGSKAVGHKIQPPPPTAPPPEIRKKVLHPVPLPEKESKIAETYLGSSLKPRYVMEGLPCVSFNMEDKDILVSKIKYVVIAKFSHGRPKFKDFMDYLESLKFIDEFNVSVFDFKHCFIEFRLFEDFAKCWMLKAVSIKGFGVRLFRWVDNFNPTTESSFAPIWIHFPGLPLYLIEEDPILSLAAAIGKPLTLDQRNLSHKKTAYVSVCVALDTTLKHPEAIWVEFKGKGQIREHFVQKVIYDAIPSFCIGCLHQGHMITTCKCGTKRTAGTSDKDISGKLFNHGQTSGCKVFDGGMGLIPDGVVHKGMGHPVSAVVAKIAVSELEKAVHNLGNDSTSDEPSDLSTAMGKGDANHLRNSPKQPVGGVADLSTKNERMRTSIPAESAETTKAGGNSVHGSDIVLVEDITEECAEELVLSLVSPKTVPVKRKSVTQIAKLENSHLACPVISEEPKGKPIEEQNCVHHQTATSSESKAVEIPVSPKSNTKNKVEEPTSWHDTVEQGLEMDFSIPPFQNTIDAIPMQDMEGSSEEEVSEEEESSDDDEQLSKLQQLEKFEEVSEELSSTKSTRIVSKKYVLKDKEKWCYSEEEEEDRTVIDFDLDPLMVSDKDGQYIRLSKLIETKAHLISRRSVSPVGRPSMKLKNLKVKLGALDIQDECAILVGTEAYEKQHQIKDTRQNQQKEEERATPKRRGRPRKKQITPKPSIRRTSIPKAPEPRKRGRPRKQA